MKLRFDVALPHSKSRVIDFFVSLCYNGRMEYYISDGNPPPQFVFKQSPISIGREPNGDIAYANDNYSLSNRDVWDFTGKYSVGHCDPSHPAFNTHLNLSRDWTPTETIVLRDTIKSSRERRIVVPRPILELMATWYDNPEHVSLEQPMCMHFGADLLSGNPEISQQTVDLARQVIIHHKYYRPVTGNEQPGDIFGMFTDTFDSIPKRMFMHSFVLAALAKHDQGRKGLMNSAFYASKMDIRKPGFHPMRTIIDYAMYGSDPSWINTKIRVADKAAMMQTDAYKNAAR